MGSRKENKKYRSQVVLLLLLRIVKNRKAILWHQHPKLEKNHAYIHSMMYCPILSHFHFFVIVNFSQFLRRIIFKICKKSPFEFLSLFLSKFFNFYLIYLLLFNLFLYIFLMFGSYFSSSNQITVQKNYWKTHQYSSSVSAFQKLSRFSKFTLLNKYFY